MSGDSCTAFPLDIGIRDVRVVVYVGRALGCWLLLPVMMLLTVVCVVVVLSVAVGGILVTVVAAGVLLASVGGAVSVVSAELLWSLARVVVVWFVRDVEFLVTSANVLPVVVVSGAVFVFSVQS